MLTNNEKEDIYNKLSSFFEPDKDIPMATIALYLKNNGIDYLSKGYKKLKNLLEDLDFIKISQKNDKDKHVEYVSINLKKKILDEKKLYFDLTKEYKVNTFYPMAKVTLYLNSLGYDYSQYGFKRMKDFLSSVNFLDIKTEGKVTSVLVKSNEKKVKEKAEIKYGVVFAPSVICSSFNDLFSTHLKDKDINKIINESLMLAQKENTLFKVDEATGFLIKYKKSKDKIIATIKKSTSKTPYIYYVNYLGIQSERSKGDFKERVKFNDYEKALDELASLAISEPWCYKGSKDKYVILKIYLNYTFSHLDANKQVYISSNKKYACFNTGLITTNYEDIYCLLEINNSTYVFKEFCIAGVKQSGKIVVENFSPLPPKAKYVDNPGDIFFDTSARVMIDYQHIILDNVARLPLTFLNKISKAFPKTTPILKNIEKAKKKTYNDDVVNKLYSKYVQVLNENNELFSFIKAGLEHAISNAIKIAQNNYHIVLPSFFPTRRVISLMLPITLEKGSHVQFVLLLEKTSSGNYQGQTILTLKQCYANARLISKLDYTFLNAKEIND